MSIFIIAFTPVSVFLSGFRRILDFFTAFLGFMSILNCSVPYCLWLPDDFGLFYCFSRPYVHFLLLGSVFLSGFRMILDFFTAFLGLMSIFSCPAPYFPLISFWLPDNFGLFPTFSVLYVHFQLLSSVLPSGFRMILDFFTAFLVLISIFTYPVQCFSLVSGSVFPSGFRMILDFFTAFLGFMSIFSCSAPYFSLASG